MGGAKSCLDLSGLSCVTWEVAFKTALKRGIFPDFWPICSSYVYYVLSFLAWVCVAPPPAHPTATLVHKGEVGSVFGPQKGGVKRGFPAPRHFGPPPDGGPPPQKTPMTHRFSRSAILTGKGEGWGVWKVNGRCKKLPGFERP